MADGSKASNRKVLKLVPAAVSAPPSGLRLLNEGPNRPSETCCVMRFQPLKPHNNSTLQLVWKKYATKSCPAFIYRRNTHNTLHNTASWDRCCNHIAETAETGFRTSLMRKLWTTYSEPEIIEQSTQPSPSFSRYTDTSIMLWESDDDDNVEVAAATDEHEHWCEHNHQKHVFQPFTFRTKDLVRKQYPRLSRLANAAEPEEQAVQ